jgi:hypothetical protein
MLSEKCPDETMSLLFPELTTIVFVCGSYVKRTKCAAFIFYDFLTQ